MPSLAFADAASAAAQANYNAAYSMWAASQMRSRNGDDSTSDKLLNYMMMSQMMQAQANLAAAAANKKAADKVDEKKDSPKIENPKLEISDLKIPGPAANEKMFDFTTALKPPAKSEPIVVPPMPSLSPEAAMEIVSSFKGAEKKPAPAPSVSPQAVPLKPPMEAKTKAPAAGVPRAAAGDGAKIGYDNKAGDGGTPPAPVGFSAGPMAASIAPGGNAVTPAANAGTEAGARPGRAAADEGTEGAGSSGGSGGSGGSSGGGGRSPSGYSDLIGDLMSAKVRPHSVEDELVMPEKQENPGANIFEYAAYRYKHVTPKIRGKKTASVQQKPS